MEPYLDGMFRDPQRGLACLRAVEILVTRHLEADRGVAAAQPLQYQFAARTKTELEATGGEASGRGASLPEDPGAAISRKGPGMPQVASAGKQVPRPDQAPRRAGKVPWS